MIRFLGAFAAGLLVVVSGRILWSGDASQTEPAARVEVPDQPIDEAERDRRAQEALGALLRAVQSTGQVGMGRAPDLVRADEMIAHFYGDPTPWDDDAAREAAEAGYTRGAERFEAAGLGHVIRLDCAAYPCIALVESDPEMPLDELFAGAEAHLDGMQPFTFFPIEVDGRQVRRVVLQQQVEDLSQWDPYLQMRKSDLTMIDGGLPPPADEELAQPVRWADTAGR